MIDNKFLTTQIKLKLHELTDKEFQSFFEKVMDKSMPAFKKVRPYGNQGDGGNDGYTDEGIYFQVYAPLNPSEKVEHGRIKDSEAVDKFKQDFNKLMLNWHGLKPITKYTCVFNDKFIGESIHFARMICEFKQNNSDIDFNLLLAKDLENIIVKLTPDDLKELGFNLDIRPNIKYFEKVLKNIDERLKEDNIANLLELLALVKEEIDSINSDDLKIKYLLTEARIFIKYENLKEGIDKFNNITEMYPRDIKAILYLAAIYLTINLDNNKNLLSKAAKINDDDWFYKFQLLNRHLQINEPINDIENSYQDSYVKSCFLSLYAKHEIKKGNIQQAIAYITQAINLQPKIIQYQLFRLLILEPALRTNFKEEREKFIQTLEKVEQLSTNSSTRTKLIITYFKFTVAYLSHDDLNTSSYLTEYLNYLYKCYFNSEINCFLVFVSENLVLKLEQINAISNYLISYQAIISKDLADALLFQFVCNNHLTAAKNLFNKLNYSTIVEVINNIEQSRYDEVCVYVTKSSNPRLQIKFGFYLFNYPELKLKIINLQPDDNIKKIQLSCHYYNVKDIDQAYDVLQEVDFKTLNPVICNTFLEIIRGKKAYDYGIKILSQLKTLENNSDALWEYDAEILLFYANLNDSQQVIQLGENLLNNIPKDINNNNIESILGTTILAYLDTEAINEAKTLLDKYPDIGQSEIFVLKCRLPIYLATDQKDLSIKTIINYFKLIKINPTKNDYANIYQYIIKNNPMPKRLKGTNKVTNNHFVKIKDIEQLYFIGNDIQLDAIPINSSHHLYSEFINKQINESVKINKYTPQINIIELIYTYEEYIFFQIWNSFYELGSIGALNNVIQIEIPMNNGNFNIQYFFKTMHEITNSAGKDLVFEEYKKNMLPLAVLAKFSGGLIPAIQQIQRLNRGYINCSDGSKNQIEYQHNIAKAIVQNLETVYLDTTSVFFIAMADLLPTLLKHVPNIKIAVSTFNFFNKLTNINSDTDQIYINLDDNSFSRSDVKDSRLLPEIFESIKKLLSNLTIEPIAEVNQIHIFDNMHLDSELIDAPSLSIRNNTYIITEDPLLLHLMATKLNLSSLKYCSSVEIIKELQYKQLIDFSCLLNYHYFLTSHRVRFLSVNVTYFTKAVFGEKIIVINPENLTKLNIKFILSREYGVSEQDASNLIGEFLFNVIAMEGLEFKSINNIVTVLCKEIPESYNKLSFMQKSLSVCYFLCNPVNNFMRSTKLMHKIDYIRELLKSEHNIL